MSTANRGSHHDHDHAHDHGHRSEDDSHSGYDIMSGTRGLVESSSGGRSSSSSSGGDTVEITAVQKMLAACSGSLLTSLLVTPLDVVRVRLQSQHPTSAPSPLRAPALAPLRAPALAPLRFHSAPSLGVTACCREVFWITNTADACLALSPAGATTTSATLESCVAAETSRRRFHGTWEGLVKIARYEGAASLWRGLSPTLLMAIPANVIYFTGYDSLRESLSSLPSAWAPLVAGASARAIAATAISPLELFRTRLQAAGSPRGFRDTLEGVRGMVAGEGVASLWRGLGLTLWRDVPFSAVYWFGYEVIKEGLQRRREREWRGGGGALPLPPVDLHAESTFADSFIGGGVSGAVAALLTTPFDVGKTRRQVASMAHREGMPAVLLGIWRSEGWGGLMRGCVPRMLKVAPACAIMISSYEVGKKAAARINQRGREGKGKGLQL